MSAYREAKARKPPIAAIDAMNPIEIGMAGQWMIRRGDVSGGASSRVSPITRVRPAASMASPAAPSHAGPISPVPDEHLAERGTERDPEIETQGVVRERLAQPLGRGEVGECREPGDEEGGFGHAGEQPQSDDRDEILDQRDESEAHRGEHRAAEEERQAAVHVGEPAGERSQHERGHRERAEGEPGTDLVSADRAGHVEGEGEDRHADRGEVREVGDSERDELGREEPLSGRPPRHGHRPEPGFAADRASATSPTVFPRRVRAALPAVTGNRASERAPT